jgi:glycosyltransferase involved in cell wall biosynthesis
MIAEKPGTITKMNENPGAEISDKIFIVARKWTYRGDQTSVERFCNMLDPDFKNYHGQMSNLNQGLSVFLKQRSNSTLTAKGTAYNSNSVKLEMYGLIQSVRRKASIVFFPYADFDYYYFGYLKKLFNKKVVLWTYFSVEELTSRFENLEHFEKADLLLVAGKEQLEFLKQNLKKPKIVYFPMGVDTTFFVPSTQFDKYQVVFSGANRRDFETAVKAFDIVHSQFPQTRVRFIGCSNIRETIPQRDYIIIHDYLSDMEMLEVYRKSHLQALTLLDGGSSNSLLEGYACGIPVICTLLPNISDYLIDRDELKVTPDDHVELSNKIINIFSNDELRNDLAQQCRKKAEEFNWQRLKEKFIDQANLL